MALDYGFAKGKVASAPQLRGTRKGAETQFHLLVDLQLASSQGAQTWQAAINVGTDQSGDLLKYRLDPAFNHPILATLAGMAGGFHELTGQKSLPALDFLRSDVLAPTGPWTTSGVIRGLDQEEPIASLEALLQSARTQQADIYVFGRAFATGLGVHDVHMNQGSTGSFVNDGVDDHNDHNDVWQDGAVLVDLGDRGWTAYFTAFAQQLAPTDDLGNPSPGAHPIGDADPGSLAGG